MKGHHGRDWVGDANRVTCDEQGGTRDALVAISLLAASHGEAGAALRCTSVLLLTNLVIPAGTGWHLLPS